MRRAIPVGSAAADPLYEIADTYLAFWFDVLGISGDRTALLGECRWQTAPFTSRDVLELRRKITFVREPADDLRLLFWSRSGAAEPGFPARAYSIEDVVG